MSQLALDLIVKEQQEQTGVLDLGNCGLMELPKELFELTHLKKLYLSANRWDWEKRKWVKTKNHGRNNQLTNLPYQFSKLIVLEELQIHEQDIVDFSLLNICSNLKQLSLYNSEIKDGDFLRKLCNLKSLYLSDNQISDIRFLEKFTNLHTLYLSSNQISDYSFLKKLTNLHTLALSYNQISDIRFLEKLTKLHTLYLSSNQISDYSFLGKLTNLHTLALRYNQVLDYSFLEKLTNLHTLALSSSQISDIYFLEKLTNLHVLDLSHNQISDICFLKKLTNLNTLDLSYNQVLDICFLKNLINLHTLHLRYNQISDICFLEKLINLHTLALRHNQISDYSFLGNLTNLHTLDISNNQISDICFLEKLSKTSLSKRLDISNNDIKDLSPLLLLIKRGIPVKWDYLENGICVQDNPFEIPPIEVIQQGNQAILNYYQELEEQGTTELYEAKMLIIGEGGAGKTSLSRKLMDEKNKLPKEKETTKGIDIQEYYFKTAADQEFRINIWDFGGQEIYHSTHQFFLTKRSLYVLVDDTRKDDKSIDDASFNYWLQTVELFGDTSPIVIVQNEKGNRSKALDIKSMQARFEHIKGTYATNLLTGRGLAATKTALEFYIQQLPHIGQQLPKQWVAIRHALEELERDGTYYISLKEYFDICAQHDIPGEERALLLSQYLHDLGVFLHFQEDDLLNKTIILHNEWATDAVYKVLDAEFVKKNKGRFTTADLKKIWGDADCKEKYRYMHSELLALMKNFELCYPLNAKEKTFLAPQLFPEVQPDYVWDSRDNLILNYEYGFMPKGLLSRFIVRFNHYVQDLKTAWRNGVLLKKGQTQAEVLSLYAQKTIRIRVRGQENKAFLDIIMAEFDKIHALFEGIRVDKLIPCNCTVCQAANSKDKYYFKYEVLKKAYFNKIDDMRCQESLELANVYRLINDTLTSKRIADFHRVKSDYLQREQQRKKQKETDISPNFTINNNNIIHQNQPTMSVKEEKPATSPSPEPSSLWVYASIFVIVMSVLLLALSILPVMKSILLMVGGILFITLLAALQLQNDSRIQEDNFIKLVVMVFKKIPPMSLFFRKEKGKA